MISSPTDLQSLRVVALAVMIATLGTILVACADDTITTPSLVRRTLVDHRLWTRLDAAVDPLATHQPPTIACGLAGIYEEFGQLEIDTNRCNYAWIEHPSRLTVPAGSEITTQLTHYDLVAPEPAEAHAALLIGDDLVWEATVAIPHDANVLDVRVQAPSDLTVGDPIRFHLHNHGQNFWSLAPITTLIPSE